MEKKGFTFLFSWAANISGLPAQVRLELYDAIIKYAQSGTVSQLKAKAGLAFGFIRKDIDEEFDGCERGVPADGTLPFPDTLPATAPSEEEKERQWPQKRPQKPICNAR